jgi:hypothetical protein
LNSSTSVNSQGIEIYDLFQDVIFKIENNLFHNTKRVGEKEKTMLEINNSPGIIRNSTFHGALESIEGAIEIKNNKSNVLIENCYFTRNIRKFGGAILYENAGINYINNCTFF